MKIFIGCSASDKIADYFIEEAKDIADVLSMEGHDLIFGASLSSMMGACYREFVANNRQVTAYTVKKYERELEDLVDANHAVLKTTMQRIESIYRKADVLLFLPGGIGSLSELLSAVEESRTLGDHKPIIVYNFEGIYDEIFAWMRKAQELGFISAKVLDYIHVTNDKNEVFDMIGTLKPKERERR